MTKPTSNSSAFDQATETARQEDSLLDTKLPQADGNAPIFIIGTERSGSNLVRLILNAHSQIAVPHPPHVMAYFAPIEKYYGDLANDENFERLADDVITHVQRHIHPWPVSLDKAKLMRDAKPRDAFGLYVGLYDQYLAATGKPRWGCKSTFMIHHTDQILARFPDARLIWIIRDPRDVAVSSRESVFNPFHPYYTARLWTAQQELGCKLAAKLSPANLLRVHYEDLIREPAAVVARICAFIGAPFEPAMLRFFETDDARTSAHLARDWRNTAKPILADNAKKFLRRLSAEEIAIMQSVAGALMEKLGYEPVPANAAGHAGVFRRARYWLDNELTRLRVEYRSLLEDRNQWRRWARHLRVMTLTTQLKLGLR